MKILALENDIELLKVVLALKLAQKDVGIEVLPTSDSRVNNQEFPILECDNNEIIESGNEVTKYLLPPSDDSVEEVSRWILWEKSELRPSLETFQENLKVDILKTHLCKLNESLSKTFLVKENVSAADICVWSSLYPIISDDANNNLYKDYVHLKSWIGRLSSEHGFQKVAEEYKIKKSFSLKNNVETINLKDKSFFEEVIKLWSQQDLQFPSPKPRTFPILPKSGENNILITSALPYVNNVPHLGNIIGCVLSADVFSRFCRLRNWNTLYISGTDEYGTATETKALEEGVTPHEICEKYFKVHKEIYEWFNIDFDYFGRTTSSNQKEVVQDIFKHCHGNEFTLTEVMDQLLCETCDRYLADRFVEGICPKCKYEDARGDQCDGCGHLINAIELIEPKCKVCRSTPVVKQSQQLFLNLPKIEPQLNKWVEESSSGWTHNAKLITKAWLREGLKPRCITRDLKWGIPVPLKGFESKVFYVWFDAPIGYMSMTKTYSDQWSQWWQPDQDCKVSLYQFMAKDNVPFHSIMFPATLISTRKNYIFVDHLMATEYLNYEDGKFSKSRGVGVFGTDAKDTGISSDVFRFYLLFVRPESQDSNFSWADLAIKNNTELLNNLGNFILRTLTFCVKFFNSEVPKIVLTDEEKQLISTINSELLSYLSVIEAGKLKEGIKYILNISRHGNQYIQSNQPWVLVKGPQSEKDRAGTVVAFSCNMVCLLAVLLHPYVPNTSDKIKEQVNFPAERFTLTEQFLPILSTSHKIGNPSPLFEKIEQTTVNALKEKYSGKQQNLENAINKLNISDETIESLEAAATKQGEIVRNLKASGAEKSVIQSEVNILLDIKNKLSLAKGEPVATKGKKKKK